LFLSIKINNLFIKIKKNTSQKKMETKKDYGSYENIEIINKNILTLYNEIREIKRTLKIKPTNVTFEENPIKKPVENELTMKKK
jgi:hypothetical protein